MVRAGQLFLEANNQVAQPIGPISGQRSQSHRAATISGQSRAKAETGEIACPQTVLRGR